MCFTSYVASQLEAAQRVEIVWDMYIADSLKTQPGKNEAKAGEDMLLPPQ